jgi:hypothetical protein
LFVLDAAADGVDGGESESYDVEGVQYPHRGAQHAAYGRGIAAIGVQCGDADADTPGPGGGR